MKFNIFKYHLKLLYSDKTCVFWLLLYPVLLATLFYLAFSNLNTAKELEKIELSVVEEAKDAEILDIVEETKLFNIKKQSYDDAMISLQNEETDFAIVIKKDGTTEFYSFSQDLNQTICKAVFDSYYQVRNAVMNIVSQNPTTDIGALVSDLSGDKSFISDNKDNKSGDLSFVYFYTILAMLSLLCGTLGVDIVNSMQANQSSVAERICIAPTPKSKALISYVAAAMCFQLVSVIVTIFYLNVVLKIDFEGHLFLVFLICTVGSILGISFGTFIGSAMKANNAIKSMLIIILSLLSCFLAGMMVIDMKYLIQCNTPLIGLLNPATLITDGIYSLYYYETFDRFIQNISILSIEALVFIVLSFILLRRQKYESI